MDCIFCKIAEGTVPSQKVYEDDTVLAFKDISPQAPVHIIVIPKNHVLESIAGYDESQHGQLLAKIFSAIRTVTEQQGLKNGFRIVNNCGSDGAQTVNHLHFHILGGKKLPERVC